MKYYDGVIFIEKLIHKFLSISTFHINIRHVYNIKKIYKYLSVMCEVFFNIIFQCVLAYFKLKKTRSWTI